jgi:energy-coupling factor transporter ATP-binding protein EcfA2
MNPDFKNTFRQEAEHRGFDPEYLLALAYQLNLPAPPSVDYLVDPDSVMAQLDIAVCNREIAAIHIANFKAFGKTAQRFPIAPITLVFGPNSAGKSSLMQALLFASHVQAEGELNVKHPKKGGTVVDLGGFANIQHRRDRESLIVLGFEFAHHFRKLGEDAKPAIWWVTIGYPSESGAPIVLSATLEIDGRSYLKFRASAKNSSQTHGISLDPMNSWAWSRIHVFATQEMGFTQLTPEQADDWHNWPAGYDHLVGPFLDYVSPSSDATTFTGLVPEVFTPWETTGEINEWESTWLKEEKTKLRPAYRDLVQQIRSDVMTAVRVLRDYIPSFLKNLGYLSSTRVQPGRDFENITQRDVNFDVNGGASWEWLASRDGSETRNRVNNWFSDLHSREKRGLAKYVFGVAYDLNRNITEEIIETEIQNYLMEKNQEHEEARARSGEDSSAMERMAFPFDHLDASEITARIRSALEEKRNASTHRRLTIQDARSNTPVTTADIGVGIQFLIPVLVEFLSGGSALKIIEEPELHAHPALQAELGDALVEGALADRRTTPSSRFLIETNSEHLILRILRRIREASEGSTDYPANLPKVRPEDVAVIYAEPSSEGTILHHLKITEDGDFHDRWPAGFFTERADELF